MPRPVATRMRPRPRIRSRTSYCCKSLAVNFGFLVTGSICKCSAVAEMGDRGHNLHGPKRGGLLCPFRGELGPRLIQCGLGRGLLPYQLASSSIQPFGHNRHGQKIGWVCLFSGGNWVPIDNTMSRRPRPTSVPSGILIHAAVWPQ